MDDPNYHGIVILVDVPFSIMNLQQNKQSYENQKEYAKLEKAIAETLDQYVRDIKKELRVDKLSDFWKEYGYLHDDIDVPDNTASFAKKRFFRIPTVIQCNDCLKWRKIETKSIYMDRMDSVFPDGWSCNNLRKSCSEQECLPVPYKGKLEKEKCPEKPEPKFKVSRFVLQKSNRLSSHFRIHDHKRM